MTNKVEITVTKTIVEHFTVDLETYRRLLALQRAGDVKSIQNLEDWAFYNGGVIEKKTVRVKKVV